MSIPSVISDIQLVGEQLFDHTPLIKREVEKFLDNFERNERHKEFDGIIRASHSLVEASDSALESLVSNGSLERLNEEIKATTAALSRLVIPTFQKEHDDYLDAVKKSQEEQLDIVEREIERQRRNLYEQFKREGTSDSLASPDVSTTSEVDLN
ncbi:hypothetical protein AB6A40_011126 [Gnathostoma spinigerum]|uniref:Biogenesis of lysosome-related organelles complex 1 subunit 5 n=1 Tax=Gnathostoma spinigerum TaxID=75299 RepID=A0ABD6EZ75_9BILA